MKRVLNGHILTYLVSELVSKELEINKLNCFQILWIFGLTEAGPAFFLI